MGLTRECSRAIKINQLAEGLGLDRSSASRRARGCLTQGYLYDEGAGAGRGKPLLLVPGEPLPEDIGVLPPSVALAT